MHRVCDHGDLQHATLRLRLDLLQGSNHLQLQNQILRKHQASLRQQVVRQPRRGLRAEDQRSNPLPCH